MGLIKAAKDAVSSLLADQWREYFYCDALTNDILVAKGKRRTTGRNGNKGVDNIISNGSIIAVNEGQCMIIVEQGGIAEFCAEAGEFVYDNSTEPSLFYGDLGENIKETLKAFQLWRQCGQGSEGLFLQYKGDHGQSVWYGDAHSFPLHRRQHRT